MPSGRPSKFKRSSFGTRLFKIRIEKGLSQRQVAESVGVSQQAYAGWERTTVAFRPEQIVNLAKNFKMTIDALLGVKNATKSK
ncbi:MAG: helix-turn-helix transcriptional regulator [Verrucomicrobiota bacterium]